MGCRASERIEGGRFLTGVAFRRGDGSLAAAGTQDAYQAPAAGPHGPRRALVRAGQAFNPGAVAVNFQHFIRTTDGVLHPLSPLFSLAPGKDAPWGKGHEPQGVRIVLEPGESIVTGANGPVSMQYAIIEYSASDPLYSPRSFDLVGGDTSFHHSPLYQSGQFMPPGLDLQGIPAETESDRCCVFYYFNGDAAAHTVTANYLVPGDSPSIANQLAHVLPGSTGASLTIPSGGRTIFGSPPFIPGDSISIHTDAGSDTGAFGQTVWGVVSELGPEDSAALLGALEVPGASYPRAFVGACPAGITPFVTSPASIRTMTIWINLLNPTATDLNARGLKIGSDGSIIPFAAQLRPVPAGTWRAIEVILSLDSGESLGIETDGEGLNVWCAAIAFDSAAPIISVTAVGGAGQTLIYEGIPKESFLLQPVFTVFPTLGEPTVLNPTLTPEVSFFLKKWAGAPLTQVTPPVTLGAGEFDSFPAAFNFLAGDQLWYQGPNCVVWMNFIQLLDTGGWRQDRQLTDLCDVIGFRTDIDNEEEVPYLVIRGLSYQHFPTRNLETGTVVGRQIQENIDTTDRGAFVESAVIPSDAYIVNRTKPNPNTGEKSRLNGIFFRVLGPVQPLHSSTFDASEAFYELRMDEKPHPDVVKVANG